MSKLFKTFPILLLLSLAGCGLATTRPKLEMTMAATAYSSAKDAKAPILAANLFRIAEEYFLKAKSAYRRKYFNKAKEYALKSKHYSERAEFKAVKTSVLKGSKDEF